MLQSENEDTGIFFEMDKNYFSNSYSQKKEFRTARPEDFKLDKKTNSQLDLRG